MEWKEYQIQDVCRLINGRAYSNDEMLEHGKYKIVRVGNLSGGNSTWFYSDLELPADKYCHNGDLLFAWACTFGPHIWKEDNTIFHYHIWKIVEDKDVVDRRFFYYYLKFATGGFLGALNGSVMVHITKSSMEKMNIRIPQNLEDQRRIASILSSLDRKIELNNKINADLEEMAQAIFKNWFVDFEPFKDGKFVNSELGRIPEGWKVGKITDIGCLITDYVSNGSFASLKQNVHLYETKEYAQFIRNTDLKTNTFSVYVDKHSYDFLSKSTLYGNEIIISNVGDVGSVHLCPKLDIPMTLGNNIIMLRPNEKEYNYFLYLWFKYFSGQGLIQGIKGGSAQPKFNKTDFKNLPLLIPSFEIIERSYWIFESMFSILSSNVKENSRLSLLRDTLLPRLMSGELEVPE